jgi:dihydroneopterin aldolase
MKEASLMRLSIVNAVFYAYHGVKSEEQVLGGKYEVDLDMFYDATHAIINDDVNVALNYEEVVYIIEEIMHQEPFNLIETLAREILNRLLEEFAILVEATIRIRKLNIPVSQILDYIEVEQTLTRKRTDA